jgi:hypothetical protein
VSRFSNSTSISIVAPSSSALAILATSMSAGTWAALTIPNINDVLGDLLPGGGGSNTQYSNGMSYISQSDSVQYIGADHGGYISMHVIEYQLSANQFVFKAQGNYSSDTTGTGPGHGFDHNTVNPTTGDAYQVLYGGSNQKLVVKKRPYGTNTYSVTLPTTGMIDQAINITTGSTWWSGAFDGAGAQGGLLVFNAANASGSVNDGILNFFDPLANSWIYSVYGITPNYLDGSGTYHQVAEYSPVYNCAVFGGGNCSPRRLYRLDSNRTVTRLTDVPAGKQVRMQGGNLTVDPVTGKFLLLSASELWELNPTGSGTWTQQTGTRVPPAQMPSPDVTDGTISCPMPNHGVVLYVHQSTVNNGRAYLYKHA